MISESYCTSATDAIYLAACAVEGIVPNLERILCMDLNSLYSIADYHSMTGIIATALESAGIHDKAFTQAKGKKYCKNLRKKESGICL